MTSSVIVKAHPAPGLETVMVVRRRASGAADDFRDDETIIPRGQERTMSVYAGAGACEVRVFERKVTEAFQPYTCHKKVRAARIEHIDKFGDMQAGAQRWVLHLQAGETFTETLGQGVLARYNPVPGDYLVKYDDDYVSISPAKAFEDGYTAD